MRGLKFLVIFMGVLILLGTSFLVFTIIQRGSKLIKPNEDKVINSAIEIISPTNMELKNVSTNDGKIIIKFEDENKFIIKILNLDTGLELNSILIKKE
ncbi:MAG: hypothetical protein CMJ12_03930 [Pelagibacterales bacterium]|nr:hypothetical protein [Pelagibacterales bacterium]PPR16922.1 MAG: hypothetical protein CFH33_00298 [Alphaproteobacteria bacterium MarineAlpha9_Bin3]|tara:strand:+ start:11645 stop:11938 length:294 start_codon:yes stop_codon:yes gene_type:complete